MTPGPSSMRNTAIFRFYDRLLDWLCAISLLICGTALVFLTVIFGWLVFGRYVLNSTPTWVEQISLLLIVLIGFLGASVGVRQKTHLGVSYFRELSPRWLSRVFELVSLVVLGAFGAIMMYYSYKLTLFKWGSQIPLIHLPEGLRTVPIMLCGTLTLLYCIGHLIHFFVPSLATANSDE
ncbi:C4-dicarboxylate ABC transporter permease [Chromatiales bacterium (ex Bugula neritina AB1)]|nr:C4-dicarboxylate ABC transporter permease [Chromatiales bacterium (ex Bugula neritina AB1)]